MMHSVANREHDSRSDTETRLLCFQVNEEYFAVFRYFLDDVWIFR